MGNEKHPKREMVTEVVRPPKGHKLPPKTEGSRNEPPKGQILRPPATPPPPPKKAR
jgi:hypothetical protein